jgi:Alanine dehydrogenase/PNT, N-terminal domain
MKRLGIMKETKNRWERRVPMNPQSVKTLVDQGYQVTIQPSETRIYKNKEYLIAGAELNEDLSNCDLIMGVKEIPIPGIISGKPHLFFSHTIKGQDYNMPLLQHVLENGSTLMDYEKIIDENGKRLVFFGKFAGNAGMVDALWATGQRYLQEFGIETPFLKVKQSYQYESLEQCLEELRKIGREIESEGLPAEICPFNICLLGYGSVSIGCQEILAAFPISEVAPDALADLEISHESNKMYMAIFKEKHLVEKKDDSEFSLSDYFVNGKDYKSKMERYLPYCTMYMSGIYWAPGYPVFLKNSELVKLQSEQPKLVMVGDITCDIEGSIEATRKVTMPDNPVFIYNPKTDGLTDGFKGSGFAVCAIDNLPCEFPKEASDFFNSRLESFVPAMLDNDYSMPIADSTLPAEMQPAVIAHLGKLEDNYQYLEENLNR